MKQFLIIGSIALSATLASATAVAEDVNMYFTPMIGASFTDSTDYDTGFGGYLILGAEMGDKWALESSLNFTEIEIGTAEDTYRRSTVTAGILREVRLLGGFLPSIEPFVTASLAGTYTEYLGVTDYAPGAEFSLGFRRPVEGKNYRLRADVRYRLDSHDGVEEYGNDVFYNWAVMFGVDFGAGYVEPVQASTPPPAQPVMAVAEAAPFVPAPVATVLPSISFPLDSAQLTRSSEQTLDQIVAILKAQPSLNVAVVGHADDTGPSGYNYQLSESRAQEAIDYVIDHGIDPTRVSLRATGEKSPVASNATADGRRENRRVAFEVQ